MPITTRAEPHSTLKSQSTFSNLFFVACGMLALPALAIGGNWLKENHLRANSATTSDPAAVTMTWDARNQLTSSTSNGVTTSYKYDALGNRVKKGDTRYLTVDNEVVAEFKGDEAKQYVHAQSIDDTLAHKDSSGLAYYHLDRQLNTEALTDASGVVLEQYAIDATGRVKTFDASGIELSGPSATNILFTGRPLDQETGLYYFRARYYEPELGTFISRDPLGFVDGQSVYQGWFLQKFLTDATGLAIKGDPVIGKEYRFKSRYCRDHWKCTPSTLVEKVCKDEVVKEITHITTGRTQPYWVYVKAEGFGRFVVSKTELIGGKEKPDPNEKCDCVIDKDSKIFPIGKAFDFRGIGNEIEEVN